MSTVYTYDLKVVHHDDGTVVATIDGDDSPLRGCGSTPVEALAGLAAALAEWPRGGADRWLDTPAGIKLARMFCPEFEPRSPRGSS